MANYINQICCTMVAVSLLEDDQKAGPKAAWEQRFPATQAVWVDAQKDDKMPDIFQRILAAMHNQGIQPRPGDRVIMVLFADFANPLWKDELNQAIQVSDRFRSTLGWHIPLTLEFGYAEKLYCASADRVNAAKKNVRAAIAVNKKFEQRIQLCLVAESPFAQEQGEKHWKPVMLLLDVLRRSHTPELLLPVNGNDGFANDDIGYLRYGEYDEKQWNALQKKRDKLEHKLGAAGKSELMDALRHDVQVIQEDISAKYPISESVIPIHPDIQLSIPGGLAGIFQRRQISEKQFAAQNSMKAALLDTAQKMQQDILAEFSCTDEKAEQRLDDYLENVQAGIDLQSDQRSMEELIKFFSAETPKSSLPELSVGQHFSIEPAVHYLEQHRKWTIEQGIIANQKKMWEAYLRRGEAYYTQKRNELQAELTLVNQKISRLMSQEQFLNMISSGSLLPEACFFPTLGGGSSFYFSLCRTSEDAQLQDQYSMGTTNKVFMIDRNYGGLVSLDSPPMKAVQLFLFDCTESRLNNLIM